MLKHLQQSMERINYQPRSKAFEELTTLHEDAIKAHAELSTMKFYDWMTEVYPKRMEKILETHFHMRLGYMEIVGHMDAGATVILNNKDVYEPNLYYTVTGMPEKRNNLREQTKALIDILSKDLDHSTGKVGESIYKACGVYLKFGIGFITISQVTSSIRPFTGAELAAIMLHEIGHAYTYLDILGTNYMRSQLLKDTFASLAKETWDKQDIEFALDYIEKSTKVKIDVPEFIKTKSALVPQFIAIGVLFLFLKITSMYVTSNRLSGKTFDGQKYSDTVFTTNNITHIERIADEFSNRHGAAADLSSAIAKLVFLQAKGKYGTPYKEGTISPGKVLADVQTTNSMFDALSELALPVQLTSVYDDDILRLEKMIENNMTIFKDSKLSPAVRKEWLEQTKRAKAHVEEFKSHNFAKWRMQWNKVLKSTSGGTFFGMFMDGNMVADYKVLQLLTDTFIRNPLYMASADMADHYETLKQKQREDAAAFHDRLKKRLGQ